MAGDRPPAGLDRVFHLAEADNWPSIQRHGLLSAEALLDLPGVAAGDHARVRRHRAARTVLANGVVVRDQTPMPPDALRGCLRGMIPGQWYALLNGKVFFWADPERLARHLRACRRHDQIVMVLDAAALLARHGGRAAVSAFNTGNARRQPAVRGRATFVPYATWRDSAWRHEAVGLGTRERPRSHRPAELTVDHAVPDVMRFIVDTHPLKAGQGIAL
ncbi:MAG TPA: hypothetical protein VJ890_02410 [Vineibacter sp.]|nr:hypothetical protein [Vineibacter sp.]